MSRILAPALASLSLLLATTALADASRFRLVETEGACWILERGGEVLTAWESGQGLPEKHVTSFVSNEAGVHVFKAADRATLQGFRSDRPGYETRVDGGTVWVFLQGQAPDHLPEKHVTILESAAGAVTTLKGPSAEVLRGYRQSRPGFAALENKGPVWVFGATNEGLQAALNGHFPEKHVTRMLADAGRVTVYKSVDWLTLTTYLDFALERGRPGYTARVHDSKLWIFEENSMEQLRADVGRYPEKHVTSLKASESGVITYKSPDRLTLKGFAAARPGHVVRPTENGPVWVFLPQDPGLSAFDAGERSEKHATRIVATEGGVLTLKADSVDILRGYAASQPGFVGRVRDGYLWIFRSSDPLLAEFDGGAELGKHVTSILNVGGTVQSLKSPDSATLGAYRESRTPPIG